MDRHELFADGPQRIPFRMRAPQPLAIPTARRGVPFLKRAERIRGRGRCRRIAAPGQRMACQGDGRRGGQPRVQPRVSSEHNQRLAAYWAEALGAPTTYSDSYGDETSVVRMHSGNGPHEEMDRRAIACFDQALADVGLAGDDRLRQVLHDYFAWATTTTMSRYHRSADDVPD